MTLVLLAALGKGFLFAFVTILPILNPAAVAPVFLSLTAGASQETRTALARRIAINVFWLMLGASLVGVYVLEFFGISLPIVRVGGGMIVVASAWRLLNTSQPMGEAHSELVESYTREMAQRQAFYPLTFPITSGPGSITAAITVGVSLADTSWSLTLARTGGVVLALLVIGALVYLSFRYAQQLLKPLGEAGAIIFLRLSAFILLCLGVQIVWNGVYELGVDLLRDGLLPLST
jgi:multiple antibiotic resistance protein